MQRWEYLQLTIDYQNQKMYINGEETGEWKKPGWLSGGDNPHKIVVAKLNELGKQGWEISGNAGVGTFIFKRPMQE